MLFNHEIDTRIEMLDDLDSSIDECIAKINLIGTQCGFSHGPEHIVQEKAEAVNYICQRFGSDTELRIPICQECLDGLNSGVWVVIYCITCNNSQWVYKPTSRLNFENGKQIIWLDECVKCTENKKD